MRSLRLHDVAFTFCISLKSTVSLAVMILAFFAVTSLAQSDQTGFPAFSSQSGGMNLGNFNMPLTIPIFSKAGRGVPVTYALHYNSTIYTINDNWPNSPQFSFYITPPLTCLGCAVLPNFGWDTGSSGLGISIFGAGYVTSSSVQCDGGKSTENNNIVFVDQHGTLHPLPTSAATSSDPKCGPAQVSGYATDNSGSFITLNSSGSWIAQDKDGNTFNQSTSSNATLMTDRNGNTLTANAQNGTGMDTLGVTTLSISSTSDSMGRTSSTTYSYPAPGGTTASVVVNYKVYPSVASGFACPNIAEYSISGSGLVNPVPGVPLVDNIVLADGSKYIFAYEPTPTSSPAWSSGAVTGRPASITLPTGGTISYSYPGPNGGISCIDGTELNLNVTTSDGTTTYSRDPHCRLVRSDPALDLDVPSTKRVA